MWDLNRAERKAMGAALVLVGVSLVTRTLLAPDPGRLEGLATIDPATDLEGVEGEVVAALTREQRAQTPSAPLSASCGHSLGLLYLPTCQRARTRLGKGAPPTLPSYLARPSTKRSRGTDRPLPTAWRGQIAGCASGAIAGRCVCEPGLIQPLASL